MRNSEIDMRVAWVTSSKWVTKPDSYRAIYIGQEVGRTKDLGNKLVLGAGTPRSIFTISHANQRCQRN